VKEEILVTFESEDGEEIIDLDELSFVTRMSLWVMECPFFFGAFWRTHGNMIRRAAAAIAARSELEVAEFAVKHLDSSNEFWMTDEDVEDFTLDLFEDNDPDFVLTEDDFDEEEFDTHA
jgi:hypothetical protein